MMWTVWQQKVCIICVRAPLLAAIQNRVTQLTTLIAPQYSNKTSTFSDTRSEVWSKGVAVFALTTVKYSGSGAHEDTFNSEKRYTQRDRDLQDSQVHGRAESALSARW